MADIQRGQNLTQVGRGRGQSVSRAPFGAWDDDLWNPGTAFSASPASMWQVMRRMQEDMDRAFNQFLTPRAGQDPGSSQALQDFVPRVDVSHDEKEYCVQVDLPGANKDDIDVDVMDHQLRIRAEVREETSSGAPSESGAMGSASGQTSTTGATSGAPAGAGQQQPGVSAQPSGEGAMLQSGSGQNVQSGQKGQRQYLRRERLYGYFERVLPIPEDVNEDAIQCDFRDGVLTCHLPRAEQARQQGRRIPVGASQPGRPSQIPPAEQRQAA